LIFIVNLQHTAFVHNQTTTTTLLRKVIMKNGGTFLVLQH